MIKMKVTIKTSLLCSWVVLLTIFLIFLIDNKIIDNKMMHIFLYFYIISILFIPGLLIQHIFGVNNKDFITTILFSIGLSISFITSTLIIANEITYAFNGVLFTKHTLLIVFLISFLFLSFSAIKKVKEITLKIEPNGIIVIFFGIFLFIITIFGTLILRITNIILLIVFFLFLFSIFIFPITSVKFKENCYPFLIWVFSLSLIFYNSIFGTYLRPTDNMYEIFTISEFILKHKIWEQVAYNNILAMPNVVLFVPFIALLIGGFLETYKYVLPFISSFIPLAVYKIAENRYNSTIAFFSSYFFASMFIYFTWCSITAKMVFAGLFLALIGVILSSEDITTQSKKILLLIFSISLIFSHYGTSAIFALGLLLGIPLIPILIGRNSKLIGFAILYIIIYYLYSIIATMGSIFNSVTITIVNTINGIMEIFTPKNYGSELLISKLPPYLEILKYLYIIAFFFALIEVIYILLKDRHKINEFLIISMTLLTFVPIPYVLPVGQYGGGRAWFIPGIFVSCLIIAGLNRLAKIKSQKISHVTLALFVAIFFAFNTGLAAEVIWKHNISPSVYISYPRIVKHGDIWEKEYLDRVTLNVYDINSASWLEYNIKNKNNVNIYVGMDGFQNLLFVGFSRKDVKNILGDKPYCIILTIKNKNISEGSYIYLSKFNVENKVIKVGGRIKPKLVSINNILKQQKFSKIYTNRGSEIYLKK